MATLHFLIVPFSLFLSPLSHLEIRSTLQIGIHRGEITSHQHDAVLSEINTQIEEGFFPDSEYGECETLEAVNLDPIECH